MSETAVIRPKRQATSRMVGLRTWVCQVKYV
jgi:hypothetical protein